MQYGVVFDYASPRIEKRQETLQNGQFLEKTRTQLDNGIPAYHTLFGLPLSEDETRYLEEVYVFHKGTGYHLSAQFTEETHESIGDTVRQIFWSFDPRPPLLHRRNQS